MHFTLSFPYFAGNQAWSPNRRLSQTGCGVVAFADLIRYRTQFAGESLPFLQTLGANTPSRTAYASFLQHFSHLYCRPLLPTGMSGFYLAYTMQQYYNRYLPSRRAYWVVGNLVPDPLTHFCLQLAQDFPVILSLPPHWVGTPLRLHPNLACTQCTPYRMGGGHFVTLVGVHTHQSQGILLEIASWGKHYFVPYCDYLRLLHCPTGWLGGGWIAHHHGVPFYG